MQGEVFDVAVDIREGSPTFGQWVGVVLSSENKRQLYIPEGFAHGFCVTSKTALFAYKCTDFYNPQAGCGNLIWNDPDIGIDWLIDNPNTEEDRPNPINTYGRTKLEGERAIQSVGGDYIILRNTAH